MKRRNGFTLMELLLVVAILAIVAAAAAPTFSGGASDALKEARKSAFLAAYQNAVTGAHMMVALGASKGYDAKGINLDYKGIIGDGNTNGTGDENSAYKLDYYAPIATRQFKNNVGTLFTLGAFIHTDHKLYITINKANTASNISAYAANSANLIDMGTDDSTKALNAKWEDIMEATAGN